MNARTVKDRKLELKDKTIARQAKEIESLKTEVSRLNAMCEEKDKIIIAKENENVEFAMSIEYLRSELKESINELKKKVKEYDDNLVEIKKMKKIFNEELFKGRWNIVKLLVK